MKEIIKYKVIIIGLGKIGCLYDIHNSKNNFIQTHAKAFSLHPCFEIIAGVDINKENRRVFENKYKIKTYKDIKIGILNNIPDIVVISTPTETHKNIIKNICNLKIKLKLIICEKPISYSLNDSKYICNSLSKLDIPLFFNYMRRSDPGVLEIKRRIDEEIIKQPIKGICCYSKGIYNNASHFINLLEYWLGNPKKIITISHNRKISENDFESDFKIYFEKGSIIFSSLFEENFSHNSIELFCSNGIIEYFKKGDKINWRDIILDKDFKDYKILEPSEKEIKHKMNVSQKNVVNEIYNFLESKSYNLCNYKSALSTSSIISKVVYEN